MKNKDNRTEFMDSVYTRVSDALKEEGIDQGWAPIVASQMMIESSWGQSPMSRIHNYFGMKATKGQQGDYFNTHEGFGSNTTHIKDKFLSFKDMDEGVRAGIRRLRDSFNAFEGTPSPEQYIANINRNPKRMYFTGDPRDYLRNIRAISAGDRMKYAGDHYAKIQMQRDTDKLNRAVQSRQTLAADALTVPNPQAQRVARTIPQPVMIPRQNQYVAVDYDRDARPREDALSALRSLDQYNKLMSLLDWNSQPQSQFAPTGVSLSYSSGGQMKKRRWDDLSMKERADLMGIAVRSGITSLDTIRDTYNQYAEGGDVWEGTPNRELPPSVLLRRMEAKRKAAQPVPGTFGGGSFSTGTGGRFKVGENTFPFAKDQNEAYDLAVAHKMKEFTFNNKRYNTKQENNPIRERNNRLAGQLRIRDEKADSIYDHIPYFFGSMEENTPLITDRNFKAKGGGIHIDPSKKGTFTAAASKHGKSVQAFASQVLAHPENYSPAMRKKANFARNAAKWHGLGGPLVDRAMTFIESDKDKHPRLFLGW